MKSSDIKFNCRYFRGDIPCEPNKLRNKECPTCDEYEPKGPRILIIKLGAIGDVIRTTPLLHRFRREYPNADISWITRTPEVVPGSMVDQVLEFNFPAVFSLLQQNFAIALNLDKDIEACALLARIHAKEKYGFILQDGHIAAATPDAEHKLVTGVFDSISKQNTKSYLDEIFEICGFDFSGEPYILDTRPEFDHEWLALRQEADKKKIIGLNTGCGRRWLTRLWPEPYWLELIANLQAAGFYPLLIGGPNEHDKNLRLMQESHADYRGTFPLQKFISLVAQCDVVVTAVTMAMHIAIGLNVPIVLLNNIFNPHEFELYHNGILLQPESGCDCYYANRCVRERHCMLDLPVELVFKAIETLA